MEPPKKRKFLACGAGTGASLGLVGQHTNASLVSLVNTLQYQVNVGDAPGGTAALLDQIPEVNTTHLNLSHEVNNTHLKHEVNTTHLTHKDNTTHLNLSHRHRKVPKKEGGTLAATSAASPAAAAVATAAEGSLVAARKNRRKYSVEFKVSVLNGYYTDPDTHNNQRKTAIKYGVNRRQIQKWLAQEGSLRSQQQQQQQQQQQLEVGEQSNLLLSPVTSSSESPAKMPRKDAVPYSPPRLDNKDALSSLEPMVVVKTEPGLDQPDDTQQPHQVDQQLHQGDQQLHQDDLQPDPFAKFVISEEEEEEEIERELTNEIKQQELVEEEEEQPINLSKPGPRTALLQGSISPALSCKALAASTSSPNISRSHPDPISTHILDTNLGRPATDVEVVLFKMEAGPGAWTRIQSKKTNVDGRASALLTWEAFQAGTYKMFFNTGDYFSKLNTKSFYPFVEIVFEIQDPSQHYHIPLLLSPYSYTTYRGS